MNWTKQIIMCNNAIQVIVLLLGVSPLQAANTTQANDLYSDMLTGYNEIFLPLLDDTKTTAIHIQARIISLNDFDELSGELTIAMVFIIGWREERITWTPSDYGGKTSMFISPFRIWRPQIFVLETPRSVLDLSNHSLMARIIHNGRVVWAPAQVIQATCSVDVTYFPFDTQSCVITLSGWAYDSSEVMLYASFDTIMADWYMHNSQWELLPSSMSNCTMYQEHGPSCVKMNILLKRRSLFYVIYLLIPIMFLSVMNNFVFFMPCNSGERTSVAITTFLSFVVYMGIVNDTVPDSSSPISYLYFYFLFLLVYSSTIMFLCIVSLRIYDKTSTVPRSVQHITRVLRCYYLRRKCVEGTQIKGQQTQSISTLHQVLILIRQKKRERKTKKRTKRIEKMK